METIVIKKEAQWGRVAYLKLTNNKVVFDDSNGEYGPVEFSLEQLEEALLIHKAKCIQNTIDKNI